jgi:hypothetical protein
MSTRASGKHAFGFCDRTGFRYPLKDLVDQIENGKPTGLRVGRDMLDKDHPQWQLGRVNANDPQTLNNPRPDQSLDESRALWSWNPVGVGGLEMKGSVGRVTVSIT